MRVVILGAVRALTESHWKNDVQDAAELLGWDSIHVDARDIPADAVVWMCRNVDALLWVKTHRHDPQGDVAAMLRRVEDAGTATVGIHLDLYWGIPRREAQIGVHPWWTCQHVFTADGGPRPWGERGVNHWWMPPPMGHRFLGRGMPAARYLCKAAFVGSCVPAVHGPHRQQLLSWARSRFRDGFARFDGRWRSVWGAELNALYASAQVVLGDSAPADGYWSDRVPLTLGRGGLLAHPHTVGMAGLGFTDETMVPYTRFRFDELGERLDSLSSADRRRITDNALTLISERHMWMNRLLDVERVIAGAGADRLRGQPAEMERPSRQAEPSGAAA